MSEVRWAWWGCAWSGVGQEPCTPTVSPAGSVRSGRPGPGARPHGRRPDSSPGWPGAPGQTRLPGAPEQRCAGTSDEVVHGDGHGSAFGADGVLAGLSPAGPRPAPVVGQSPASGDRSGRRRDRVSSGSLCSGAFQSPPGSTRSAGRSRGDSSADGVLLMAVGPVPSRRRVVLMTRVWRMPEGSRKT